MYVLMLCIGVILLSRFLEKKKTFNFCGVRSPAIFGYKKKALRTREPNQKSPKVDACLVTNNQPSNNLKLTSKADSVDNSWQVQAPGR